jgi:hypothetical protein
VTVDELLDVAKGFGFALLLAAAVAALVGVPVLFAHLCSEGLLSGLLPEGWLPGGCL